MGFFSFKRNSFRKPLCLLLTLVILLTALCLPVSGETSDPPALVSQEYLQKQLDALRKELLDAIGNSAGNASGAPSMAEPQESAYRDVTLPRGSVITLGDDAEVIFRGGYAVVLTVSDQVGTGITDLATGEEAFSGAFLQFAHIYYKSAPGSRVSLLVTGEKAAFTLKGTYELS